MAGGGAPAGGESLIPGRPVAGARHGGIRKELGDVAELWARVIEGKRPEQRCSNEAGRERDAAGGGAGEDGERVGDQQQQCQDWRERPPHWRTHLSKPAPRATSPEQPPQATPSASCAGLLCSGHRTLLHQIRHAPATSRRFLPLRAALPPPPSSPTISPVAPCPQHRSAGGPSRHGCPKDLRREPPSRPPSQARIGTRPRHDPPALEGRGRWRRARGAAPPPRGPAATRHGLRLASTRAAPATRAAPPIRASGRLRPAAAPPTRATLRPQGR